MRDTRGVDTRCPRSYGAVKDDRLQDLGPDGVVRFIGNMGLGRYAREFRAAGVTGEDLASCTDSDLIRVGLDFRWEWYAPLRPRGPSHLAS